MSEEARIRNAVMKSIQNLEKRVAALESAGGGWGEWARRLIIALIAALLAVLGYKELFV